MLIRQEVEADIEAIDDVHRLAFVPPNSTVEPVEVDLVRRLREDIGWRPELSLVAEDRPGGDLSEIVGHVVCTVGVSGSGEALGLGPLGVLPRRQGDGVGEALMHAVIAAADALGFCVVVLLGNPLYYERFGFGPASEIGITSPDLSWASAFQARALSGWTKSATGQFEYAAPFKTL